MSPDGDSGAHGGRFFLPGPTEVRPEVLQAQVGPMIPHRGEAFAALMAGVQEGLGAVFLTRRPVFVSTASATGLMEAAVRNSGTGRLLCLVNGAFGERFAAIAEACGRAVDRLEVPWGHVHDPSEVALALGRGDYDAVTLVHSETSTGALQPVAEITRVVREASDALVLVDSVSGVGGAEIRTDDWELDFTFTASQKALALPPGLAFGVASERMLAVAARTPGRGHYFDLVAHAENMMRHETPTTPALTLLLAARAQLARIRAEGLEARWARHRAMAERVWTWAAASAAHAPVALEVLAPEGARSPTVTALVQRGGRAVDLLHRMAARGWVLGGGRGELRETTLRVGHMGDHTPGEVDALLDALAGVCAEVAAQ